MKRLFALLLALGMLFTSTLACAEEFTLRNGIAFGDTMDEVLAKETFPFDEDFEDLDDDGSDLPYSIRTDRETIAGISYSAITYKFDKNKTLREVYYDFGFSSESEDTNDVDYDNINSGLIRKYGTPLNHPGELYVIIGAAFEKAISAIVVLGKKGDIIDYDEWIVDTDDYHVKIDQVKFYWIDRYDNKWKYGHRVSYKYFTDEDIQNALNEKQEQQNLVDSDI